MVSIISDGPQAVTVHMLILGVDPGLETTGYALLRAGRPPAVAETGIIATGGPGQPLEARLLELHHAVRDVLVQHRPAALAMEEVFSHAAFPRTAILMGHARGVIALAAAEAGVPLHSYDATRVKSLLTGNGQAGKDEVARAVAIQLRLSRLPAPDHVADALAMALCHLESAGARRTASVVAGR